MGAGVSASYGGAGASPQALTTGQFAILQQHAGAVFGHVDGCAVTAGGGTREVVVAAGTVWLPGTYHTVSGVTLSLPENTSGQPRRDSIVLEYDWDANDAQVRYVTGTPAASPVAPNLTRSAGDVWQVELAEVPVAAGQTVLSSVFPRQPGQWHEPAPGSPWANYGSGWENLGWRIRPDGDIEMRGLITTTSTITSPRSQRIASFPARYRPANTKIFDGPARDGAFTSAEQAFFYVYHDDGEVAVVYPQSTTGTRWYSLENLRWTPTILEA